MMFVCFVSTCVVSDLPYRTFMDYMDYFSLPTSRRAEFRRMDDRRTLCPISVWIIATCCECLLQPSQTVFLLLYCCFFANTNCASRQHLFSTSFALFSGVLCDLIIVFGKFLMG